MHEIGLACQVWGGGAQPLIPLRDGQVPDAYNTVLVKEQIDYVAIDRSGQIKLPSHVEARANRWGTPIILVACSQPLDKWRPVEIVGLAIDDPWLSIYTAVLGTWPLEPDPSLLDYALLDDGLRFEDFVPVERIFVEGSLHDLVARTIDRNRLTPRTVANMFLASGMQPDNSLNRGVGQVILPDSTRTQRSAGPNLIVVCAANSTDDIALLWNLRGAHGAGRVLPIGVPVAECNVAMLQELSRKATLFGLSGGKCHVVSASIPITELRALLGSTTHLEAVPYEEVLTFGPAPGRPRSHLTQWRSAKARLEPLSEGDRELLLEAFRAPRAPSLLLDVAVEGYPLPADPTMRGNEWFGRFQAGSAQVAVSRLRERETVGVQWPSSWTCLAAVAQSRGLDIRASEPGLACTTLIRSLGDIGAIGLLRHRPLLDLVYRMAERSGMSWWKRRWRTATEDLMNSGVERSVVEHAAERLGRDDPAVAPSGEGRAVVFSEFAEALGGAVAADNWIRWAERRHLLVRGADINCPDCKTKSWQPLAGLPPPVPCPGCGRGIAQPYSTKSIMFTYRLGEPLRRVLETDSLGHLLALHWFVRLFDRQNLVGAHPGVTFYDPSDNGRSIGEADLVLLFADGSIVPVEVKRTGSGVDARTLKLMDSLAAALDAPWDALVVTAPARNIPSLVTHERRLPDRPRFVLTDDQLHEPDIRWSLGSDPFAWEPLTEEQDKNRTDNFSAALAKHDPDLPADLVAETLLDRTIEAARLNADRRTGPNN